MEDAAASVPNFHSAWLDEVASVKDVSALVAVAKLGTPKDSHAHACPRGIHGLQQVVRRTCRV